MLLQLINFGNLFKGYTMQKVLIFFMLVLTSLLAKSQDSTDFTLTNINRYAMNIEESLFVIGGNLKADKYEALSYGSEYIKAYIDSIDTEMEYLPDEYYYRLSPIVNSYHRDINEFQKLANAEFPDKSEELSSSFNNLQQRQTEFRKLLRSAYVAALQQTFSIENKTEEKKPEKVIEAQSAIKNTTKTNNAHVVFTEVANPTETTANNNDPLLRIIHQSQQQIRDWIDDIHLAMKKNNFSKAGVYAKSIANASLKISDLTLLLQTTGKENLFILANGLKTLSETLHRLSLKAMPARNNIHELIDKIEIKFSTLSTGLSLVQ